MRFRRRVVLAFTSLVFVVVLVATSAVVVLRVVLHANEHIAGLTDDLALVQTARLQAEQLVAVGRGYLLSGSDEARRRLDRLDARFDETLQEFERRANTSSMRDGFAPLQVAADAYVASIRRVAKERVATGDPATIVDAFEDRIKPLRDRFEAAADDLVRAEKHHAKSSARAANSLARTAEVALFALLAIALVLAFGLALTVARKLIAQYQDVERARESARRAATTRDELLAVVSHDLKTPLSTVTLGAGLLAESALQPEQARAARAISNAAERMQHLIEELLSREQLESGTITLALEALDARDVIATVIELYRDQARARGIALLTDVAEVEILVDRERLLQVLSNLVGNALKFTGASGTVTIRVAPEQDSTRFEVTDTGTGIPSHQLPRIFDQHFQGDTRTRGSLGLGLWICRRLVEAHHGSIGARSVPNRGTTFWFTIPRRAGIG